MPDKITKFLNSLDKKTRERIKKKLLEIYKNPYDLHQVKKMKAWGKTVYRLRVGNIRIIYQVIGEEIEIIDIDFRGNIY